MKVTNMTMYSMYKSQMYAYIHVYLLVYIHVYIHVYILVFCDTEAEFQLGVVNGGTVYAVSNYEASNDDELVLKFRDRLTVIRKGDETEHLWWWACNGDVEGYVACNFISVSYISFYFAIFWCTYKIHKHARARAHAR